MSAGFGDIAPAVEVVDIRGKKKEMQGLSYEDMIAIWRRFRDAAKALEDNATPEEFVAMFPNAVAALLAAGIGKMGDEKAEREAARLSMGDQAKLVEGVFRATFSEGYGPFVQMARVMGYNVEPIIQAWIGPSLPSPSSTESEHSLKPAA